jgi:signal transduction histidine kinase
VAAEEDQRRRIAVDVHDDSIQAMAAVALRLQVLRRHSPTPEFADKVAVIEQTANTSMARLRRLLFQLDSASLQEMGLGRALARYANELFSESGLQTTSRASLKVEPPSQMRTILYRIGQEAFNNIRKHANAKRVWVSVAPLDGGVLMTVQDDGVGFDVEAAAAHSLPGHLGMRSMRERAALAEGWVKVESAPGAGTTIRVWLPTPKELVDD